MKEMQIYLIKTSMSFVSFVCFQTVKLIPNKVSKIKNKGCIPQRLKSTGYSNVILIKVQWNTIESQSAMTWSRLLEKCTKLFNLTICHMCTFLSFNVKKKPYVLLFMKLLNLLQAWDKHSHLYVMEWKALFIL